jgi:hypothetical protein
MILISAVIFPLVISLSFFVFHDAYDFNESLLLYKKITLIMVGFIFAVYIYYVLRFFCERFFDEIEVILIISFLIFIAFQIALYFSVEMKIIQDNEKHSGLWLYNFLWLIPFFILVSVTRERCPACLKFNTVVRLDLINEKLIDTHHPCSQAEPYTIYTYELTHNYHLLCNDCGHEIEKEVVSQEKRTTESRRS